MPVGPIAPASSASASASSSKMLERGSRGPEVLSLQRALLAAGFDPRGLDGVFGPKTQAAVIAFQRAQRIVVDGKVGPQTWGALHRVVAPASAPQVSPSALIPPRSRVLLVGDSHTRGHFGLSLEKQLRASGMTVSTYASGGRSARHWVAGHVSAGNGFRISSATTGVNSGGAGSGTHTFEPLEQLIRRERPSVLVMADGSNMLDGGGHASIRKVKQLADKYGVRLVWVGPPEMRKFSTEAKYYAALRANLGPTVPVLDSRPATQGAAAAGMGDGVHYYDSSTRRPATDWASDIFRRLIRERKPA